MKSIAPIVYVLLALGTIGCSLADPEDTSTEPTLDPAYRIVWRLESIERPDAHRDVDRFAPFRLVFDSTRFAGDDGCNSFEAGYVRSGGGVRPVSFVMTERACALESVSPEHLVEPFRVELGVGSIVVVADDGRYHYRTAHAAPVDDSPLLAATWRLTASTDSALQALEGEFVPELRFESSREYTIRWRCAPDNLFGCNRYRGFWGVGYDDAIVLYPRTASLSGLQHAQTIRQIEDASTYLLRDGDLVLLGANHAAIHRLAPLPSLP